MSLMAANEESDPSAILNGFWVTLLEKRQFFESFQSTVYMEEEPELLVSEVL